MPTSDELRRLADLIEDRETLEQEFEEAREAYLADPDDESKKTDFKDASERLREIRQDIRGSNVMVASTEPGSVTVGAPMVGRQAPQAPEAEEMEEPEVNE